MGTCNSCASDRKEDDDKSKQVEDVANGQATEYEASQKMKPHRRLSHEELRSQVVKLEITFSNLDYDHLIANSDLVSPILASIRAAVATEAGPAIQENHVNAELSKGSVKSLPAKRSRFEAKFRVGDPVKLNTEGRAVGSDYDWSKDPLGLGDVGTVVKIDGASGQSLIRGPSGHENWYEAKDIEIAPKANFRVGDYVKLSVEGQIFVEVGYDWSQEALAPGNVAVVVKIDEASGQSLVRGPKGHEHWYESKDIELAHKAKVTIRLPLSVEPNDVASKLSNALAERVTSGLADVPGIEAVAFGGEIFAILTSAPEVVDGPLPAPKRVSIYSSSASTSADSSGKNFALIFT